MGMYRLTKLQKFRERARKTTNQMRGLMKIKGIINIHKYLLMEDKLLATFSNKKDSRDVGEAFNKVGRLRVLFLDFFGLLIEYSSSFSQAISNASKAGLMQDAALANEFAGE